MENDGKGPFEVNWMKELERTLAKYTKKEDDATEPEATDEVLSEALSGLEGVTFMSPQDLMGILSSEPSLNYSLTPGTAAYSDWAQSRVTGREDNVVYVNFRVNNEYAGF